MADGTAQDSHADSLRDGDEVWTVKAGTAKKPGLEGFLDPKPTVPESNSPYKDLEKSVNQIVAAAEASARATQELASAATHNGIDTKFGKATQFDQGSCNEVAMKANNYKVGMGAARPAIHRGFFPKLSGHEGVQAVGHHQPVGASEGHPGQELLEPDSTVQGSTQSTLQYSKLRQNINKRYSSPKISTECICT
jgi:hypothetical protein